MVLNAATTSPAYSADGGCGFISSLPPGGANASSTTGEIKSFGQNHFFPHFCCNLMEATKWKRQSQQHYDAAQKKLTTLALALALALALSTCPEKPSQRLMMHMLRCCSQTRKNKQIKEKASLMVSWQKKKSQSRKKTHISNPPRQHRRLGTLREERTKTQRDRVSCTGSDIHKVKEELWKLSSWC